MPRRKDTRAPTEDVIDDVFVDMIKDVVDILSVENTSCY